VTFTNTGPGERAHLERGRTIIKGSTLLASEPVVAEHSDSFRLV
jgi:hypothetical protein